MQVRGLSDENPNSIHSFAKEQILAQIYKLQQTNQTRLPSELKLSQELGISRISIRSALDELITEGRIYRRSGSGSYINPALSKLKATLFPAQIPQDTIRACGYTPTASYLGHTIEKVDEPITEALALPPHTPLVISKTLFYGDGIPCILCTDYWEHTLLSPQRLQRLYEQNSIFIDLLTQETGRSVRWNLAKFSAVDTVNQPKLQTYFNLPGQCAPIWRRITPVMMRKIAP